MKKFLSAVALLTIMAAPAFAQSFDPQYGTGNTRPFSYAPAQQNEKAVQRNGHGAFALAPRAPSAINPDDPALTGGGSLGYNEKLKYD